MSCVKVPHLSLVQQAEQLLRQWPARLAMIPTVKPLDEAWLPRQSPSTGLNTAPGGRKRSPSQPPHWWRWSPDDPAHLIDATTDQPLPGTFPYRNVAAMQAFTHTLNRPDDLAQLAQAYQQAGDARFALAVVDLLAGFAPHYIAFPLTLQEEANPLELRTHGTEICGRQYAIRVGPLWRDTRELQGWLRAYRLVRSCPQITRAQDDAVRALTTAVLETSALPNFLYFNDKYHNSLTNYYEAFVLSASIWGQAIEASDVVSGQTYRGGDLAQLAINGPAGLRMFIANAFDREGVYWELSSSYTLYVLNYLDHLLPVLSGYSDPEGYKPSPSVVAIYQPLNSFHPADALPTLWRAVRSLVPLALNGGQLLPTNDANEYADNLQPRRVDPQLLRRWAQRLESSQLRRLAQHAQEFLDGKPGARLFAGSTLMAASGAVTLRGPANRLNVHLDWHGVQDYHSHLDPLNLLIAAEGHLALDDLGYHLGHPLRHILTTRTAAHNTVTVDECDCLPHGRGRLHHAVLDDHVQFVEASVPQAYNQCDRYRRAVVLVGDRYVLDVFSVAGGQQHDYTLLGRSDQTQTTLTIGHATEGTLAQLDSTYLGFEHLEASAATAAPAYAVMHHPRFANVNGPFRIDWVHRDRPELTTRVHHLACDDKAEAVLVRVPYRDRRRQDRISTDEALLVRRRGRPGLRSLFVSVFESVSAAMAPLADVQRLEINSADPNAVAVRVRYDAGSDVIILAEQPGLHHVPGERLTLDGTFAAVCSSHVDRSTRMTLLGSHLHTPLGTLKGNETQGSRVVGIDIDRGQLQLDQPLTHQGLARQFIAVRGSAGIDSHWRVAALSADGLTITLDNDHSGWITLQGVVERLENPHVFTCGLRLTEPPPLHSQVRIGAVGSFASPRHTLQFVQQTGLPLKIGGTTTNDSPRTYRMGLAPASQLTEDQVGQPFWISGIEIGDVISVESAAHQVFQQASQL